MANTSKALNDDFGIVYVNVLDFAGFTNHIPAPSGRRFISAAGPSQGYGLAGNHSQDGMANGHGIGIHDPGHRLGICVDIRSGNIPVWANHYQNLKSVTPGETFQFALRHALGIANHSALSLHKEY